jgi:hypothetical protein
MIEDPTAGEIVFGTAVAACLAMVLVLWIARPA